MFRDQERRSTVHVCTGTRDRLRALLGGPIRTKAISTENRSSGGRLEGHRVKFTALVTGYLKLLPLSARTPWPSKIRPAGFPARFTSLRVGQISFLVVLLLAFSEWKCISTFNASDIDVRHGSFLHGKLVHNSLLSIIGTAGCSLASLF
jgi:hypothetical protein